MHPDVYFGGGVLLALVALAVAANRRFSNRVRWAAGVAVAAGLLIATWFRPNIYVLRALLAALAHPGGLLWLMLGAATVGFFLRRRWAAGAAFCACFLLWTLAGNAWLAAYLMRINEHRYAKIDPLNSGDFDAVVVLGGAVDAGPLGQPQLVSFSADRPVLAARLYRSGRTQRLIATGAMVSEASSRSHEPSLLTAQLWEELGVPESDILQVGGHNTFEEARQVAKLVQEHNWKRIGLVTSAWHLDRALKHFRAAGLDPVPLPCSFLGYYGHRGIPNIVPDPYDLGKTKIIIREWVANAAGR